MFPQERYTDNPELDSTTANMSSRHYTESVTGQSPATENAHELSGDDGPDDNEDTNDTSDEGAPSDSEEMPVLDEDEVRKMTQKEISDADIWYSASCWYILNEVECSRVDAERLLAASEDCWEQMAKLQDESKQLRDKASQLQKRSTRPRMKADRLQNQADVCHEEERKHQMKLHGPQRTIRTLRREQKRRDRAKATGLDSGNKDGRPPAKRPRIKLSSNPAIPKPAVKRSLPDIDLLDDTDDDGDDV